ncbi:MAG TPA: hypothetical protein VFX97_05550 [Pyrinomonadaceae bacterium]|nr:hypothetical protein [Pyrinomonadaceae bacterium]
MSEKNRPAVRVSFKFNKDTGEIVEFIVDDNSPNASEEFHDRVAKAVSSRLARHPEIVDAGQQQSGTPTLADGAPVPEERREEQPE